MISQFLISEMGAAHRFADKYAGQIVYVPEEDAWRQYDQACWRPIDQAVITYSVGLLIDDVQAELTAIEKRLKCAENEPESANPQEVNRLGKRRDGLQKQWGDLQKHNYQRAVSLQAAGQPQLRMSLSRFDDPDRTAHLVNCLNGTLNLQTQERQQHNPEDYLTRVIPVEYHPDALCPKFHAWLNKITKGDTELQGYLQLLLGSSLHGRLTDEFLHIAYGGGGDGKSTLFYDIIASLLGTSDTGYARCFEAEAFTDVVDNAERPTSSRMKLRGCRLALFKEPRKGAKLNEARVRGVSQREKIEARNGYDRKPIDFMPSQTAVLIVNNPTLKVEDDTPSMRRRLRVIPFPLRLPEHEYDTELGAKMLAEEREGIFTWLVKGAFKWWANGKRLPSDREMPFVIQEATQRLWMENAPEGTWIQQCSVPDRSQWHATSEYHASYCVWMREHRMPEERIVKDEGAFGKLLAKNANDWGLALYRRSDANGYWGRRLVTGADDMISSVHELLADTMVTTTVSVSDMAYEIPDVELVDADTLF